MYKCVKGHFTNKEHDGKNCPYDNMSASELSEELKEEIPDKQKSQKEFIKKIDVINKLKSFEGKEVGTYNYDTGELVDLSDGYMVTFHQNEPDVNGNYKSHYGRYTPDEYDELTNKFAIDNNAEVFIGVFDDEPEISFKVKDFELAIKLMIENNQDSIWDNQAGAEGNYEKALIKNVKRNKKNNPLRGE